MTSDDSFFTSYSILLLSDKRISLLFSSTRHPIRGEAQGADFQSIGGKTDRFKGRDADWIWPADIVIVGTKNNVSFAKIINLIQPRASSHGVSVSDDKITSMLAHGK